MPGNIVAAIFGLFTLLFVAVSFRQRSPDQRVARRAPASRVGIVLQGVAFGVVFSVRASRTGVFQGWFGSLTTACVALALVLAAWTLLIWARRTLGRQWSLSARLVEGHRLIVTGPYRFVRHPIYLGLLFLLLAAGLAETTPLVLAVATAIYLVGFLVRIRAEERLLREAFGEEWDAYRRRVAAIIPFA